MDVFISEKKDKEEVSKKTATPTKKNDVVIHEDPLLAVKPRRKMRRSVSFSEGQKSPQKTPVKSGYNKHLSAKYDAIAAFEKQDNELTKKDLIQVRGFSSSPHRPRCLYCKQHWRRGKYELSLVLVT